MAYFNEDFNDFWAELALNNEKSWFDANRKRYQEVVKKPWEDFIKDLIEEARKITSIDDLPVGKFLSRINRDIRFSNDKTPYNTHVWAGIAQHGKKTPAPGFFIGIGVEGISFGGGMYRPDKPELTLMRRAIMKNPNELHKLLDNPKFKKHWGGELNGDKNKIFPPEFKEAAKAEPLIANKGWHYWYKGEVDDIAREDLIEWVIEYFKAGQPVNLFFQNALKK